jgi:hypothetical protein
LRDRGQSLLQCGQGGYSFIDTVYQCFAENPGMVTPEYILNTFGALQREYFVSVIDPPPTDTTSTFVYLYWSTQRILFCI